MPMRLKLRSYYFFAVMGMIVVSQGSLMSPMLQKFDLSYASGGMLIAVNSMFYLISGLLAGVLIDRIEHRFVIFSGNVAFVLSMLTLTFAQNYLWLIIAWSLCGIGWGLLNSSVNSLINDQTGGNPSILSRMHMLYGVGAFVIPLVVRFFLGTRFGYLGATILLTAAAVGGLLLAFGVPGGAVARSPKEARKRLGSGWILFAAILFFYVGTEASFNNWMVSILTDAKGFQPQDAQTLLAVFWVSMIVGRLVTSLIPRIRSIGLVLLGLSIASLVSLAIFLFVAQPTLIVASIILIGLSLSAIYPLTFAASGPFTAGSGLGAALVISGGGLGASAVPFASGIVADMSGVFAIGILMILSAAIMTGLASWTRRFTPISLTKADHTVDSATIGLIAHRLSEGQVPVSADQPSDQQQTVQQQTAQSPNNQLRSAQPAESQSVDSPVSPERSAPGVHSAGEQSAGARPVGDPAAGDSSVHPPERH